MNESNLRQINKRTIVLLLGITIILTIAPFVPVSSNDAVTSPMSFSQALVQVHQAESAGATPQEISGLVNLLNRVVELNHEAMQPSALNDTARESELTSEINQTLGTVESEAAQLTMNSTQRAHANTITLYAEKIIIAVLGTIAYSLVTYINDRYKVKRVFQMRIKNR